MKYELVSLILSASSIYCFSSHNNCGTIKYAPETECLANDCWIPQFLDHFNKYKGKWQQRYQVNAEFYEFDVPGPVFLSISGEKPLNKDDILLNTTFLEYAKENEALIFQLEHRYYGLSQPRKSWSSEDLQYLSSKQALEDLAHFIQFINCKYDLPENTKWITFGGSYAGSLSTWMRLKYPYLVYAAVSVSAPLLAEINFTGYLDIVWEVLNKTIPGCSENTVQAFKEVYTLIQTAEGFSDFVQLFNLCYPTHVLLNDLDRETIIKHFINSFSYQVQYNNKDLVYNMCLQMTDNSLPPIKRLSMIFEYGCITNSYKDKISSLQNENITHTDNLRQWTYQTCSEFGWYQTLGELLPSTYYLQICTDIFGPSFSENQIEKYIDDTNFYYGAQNINITNVIYIQGMNDPWYPLGIYEKKNSEAPAFFITDTGHNQFLKAESFKDSKELKEARIEVGGLIADWIRN